MLIFASINHDCVPFKGVCGSYASYLKTGINKEGQGIYILPSEQCGKVHLYV